MEVVPILSQVPPMTMAIQRVRARVMGGKLATEIRIILHNGLSTISTGPSTLPGSNIMHKEELRRHRGSNRQQPRVRIRQVHNSRLLNQNQSQGTSRIMEL